MRGETRKEEREARISQEKEGKKLLGTYLGRLLAISLLVPIRSHPAAQERSRKREV